jgi:SPP1 gp7 family putative phage head morphogenesis protein
MAKSINEQWFDALIRHQIHLLRVNGTVRNKIFELLNKSDRDIQGKILARLQNVKGGLTPRNVQRLAVLQRIINNSRIKTWSQVNRVWFNELRAITRAEPISVAGTLNTVVPVQVPVVLPTPTQLNALVNHHPFEGRVLKEWAKDVRVKDLQRIKDQIMVGVVQGESNVTIARRVVGTTAMKGMNGVTQITRNQAAAITRTAVNSFSNAARELFFQENSELFKKERYVSTLDDRTTPVCRAYDGKEFKVGEGPIPPLHFNCRSVRIAVIEGAELSNRPAKPFTEKQLVSEYAKNNKLGNITSRDNLPRGFKTSFDDFKRQRVRQLTGTVPGKTTYQEWLKGQTKDFQEDVLGKTKAKLFRDGDLALDKYVDRAGNELTLAELAQKEIKAFRAAGLDPKEFR